MRKISQFAVLSALVFATACGNTSQDQKGEKSKSNKPLVQLTLKGPVTNNKHLFLRIVDDVKTDSSHIYTTQGLHDQDTVGLKIEVVNQIRAGIIDEEPNDDVGFSKGKIKISSLGAQSDAFIKALGSIYEIKTSDPFTSATLLPNVFSSNKVNVDLDKTATYSFKLFLDNSSGTPAEMFFSVDTYKRSVEFSEKDPKFRPLFIGALTGK
ncbi:hypothetical protein LZQ00_09490 [Sphingobacterium sp. SRCM116780]|uniref:hypothetical protein n=1 Tax=Sphingobacterium sp. SRCM116780 TaxID=2907623 RepID=UPI001F26C275|nr:hypothetical protein [Sphingobacterium sp. SRCM116780]UIR54504.1 hypothetical protein LZQ00_09490 [Sphingobacterium sp. SRCM116780]